ncbi:phospholipase D family protein [Caballeronia sp. SBC2]|uniref:phospholipase D family nuclease n=1 Tax=Caballeronia sp. SBC2 TaxID=2705547 RepID=UPI0013E13501|nr:phospholipase D family protein [Caballeronia sp. SBC2]QIE30379.1 PLD-like domain protein [Caballeronia sp. SBC2]
MIQFSGSDNSQHRLAATATRLILAILIGCSLIGCPLSGSATTATVQVGFSPEGSAQTLVLDVIHTAKHDIRMMGYDFTAPDIAHALVDAQKRGLDVKIVLDARSNNGRASRAAMNALVNGGIELRTIDRYNLQHDKVIITDGRTVETGSFNYTSSAERSNSENAVVIWNFPDVAASFLSHWQNRWDQGHTYHSTY